MEGYLITLSIAVIWGFFADVRKGKHWVFLGRLIFMLVFYHIMTLIMG